MKKLWAFIKNWFLENAEDDVLDAGAELLETSLEKYYLKNPTACAALVSSIYPWLDTIVEDLAAKTEKEYDDHAVDEAKKELEEFAVRHGFELTNLDAGTPGD